jgi:hypothetical protein
MDHTLPSSKPYGSKTVMRYDHGRENLDQNAVNFWCMMRSEGVDAG